MRGEVFRSNKKTAHAPVEGRERFSLGATCRAQYGDRANEGGGKKKALEEEEEEEVPTGWMDGWLISNMM
jgi:hypothetical protein